MAHSFLIESDTIAAIATPPGKGGIAIIRVSGKAVSQVIEAVLGMPLPVRKAVHLPFKDENNDILDQGIAIYFPGPASFTGEDVLELHAHGGPVITDLLLQRLLNLGVRLARPGEFSERAFLNGKFDLTQVEAISDLINASSKEAARSAMRSLQGEFSNEVTQINQQITQVRMFVEAAIDFAEEEIDFLSHQTMHHTIDKILCDLNSVQLKAKQGSLLRDGITAIIMGEPNTGKSSLLNRLSGKDLAIVTEIPGTTRDILQDDILIDGIPIHLLDTAGLRQSEDSIEQEGIRRAYHAMKQADLILYVTDSTTHHPFTLPELESSQAILLIQNKIDLTKQLPFVEIRNQLTHIGLSAKSGAGLDLLKTQIKQKMGLTEGNEGVYLARRRHLEALAQTQAFVEGAKEQLQSNRHPELCAEELRLAQKSLGEITGELTSEDLLGNIFSHFCIGK